MYIRTFLVTLFLIAILQIVPAQSFATSAYHRIAINFSFDSSSVPNKELKGYRLYASGKTICEKAATVEPKPLNCTVKLIDGTYPFTLSVTFQDGTETAQSPPFEFTLSEATALPRIDTIIQSLLLFKKDRI